jgi:acetoacetyl-CoA synthetase
MATITRRGDGRAVWTPSKEFGERSRMADFMRWLERNRGLRFDGYEALHAWSVQEVEAFWGAVWDYFGVRASRPYGKVLDRRVMPGARWFEGAELNFAEHMLRFGEDHPDRVALRHLSELRPLGATNWAGLASAVRRLASAMRAIGIGRSDRVVAYMPNVPETLVAMLATLSIGAVWSVAAPEFGASTVIDRFGQIEPKLIFVADGYRFGGRDFDRREDIGRILAGLPTLEHVVMLPHLGTGFRPDMPSVLDWEVLLDTPDVGADAFVFEQVPADHPVWVLFSSGTTGLPKPIVHGTVGVLVMLLMAGGFHMDLGPDDAMFFYTTTGWMMWNALVACLLHGATAVLYDGHPAHPSPDLLWKLAADTGATNFGVSPTYLLNMAAAGVVPKDRYDVSAIRTILLSGSPATPENFDWLWQNVGEELWITSQSGGTEICSAFVGAVPIEPVVAGQIQAPVLGIDAQAWDEAGSPVFDKPGELVVAAPSPSMPIYFWNDPGGERYRSSYFDVYPGVWRHGDLIEFYSGGGCYIHGRSDSTLNRHGVRIGTAEIYRCMEQIDGVADSIVTCIDKPGGRSVMILFVVLRSGELDDGLRRTIVSALRKFASPRHVPDLIEQVAAIPYTLTGKKMEVPVRRVLSGEAPDAVASPASMRDPKALQWFADYASTLE